MLRRSKKPAGRSTGPREGAHRAGVHQSPGRSVAGYVTPSWLAASFHTTCGGKLCESVEGNALHAETSSIAIRQVAILVFIRESPWVGARGCEHGPNLGGIANAGERFATDPGKSRRNASRPDRFGRKKQPC